MRLPISLKIFSITTALLVLMVVVTWLSVLNFRQLNNQVRALSDWYLPLQQQVASVEILIRQQIVHMERVMAGMEVAKPDPNSSPTNRTASTCAESTPTRSSIPSALAGRGRGAKMTRTRPRDPRRAGQAVARHPDRAQHFHMTFRLFPDRGAGRHAAIARYRP